MKRAFSNLSKLLKFINFPNPYLTPPQLPNSPLLSCAAVASLSRVNLRRKLGALWVGDNCRKALCGRKPANTEINSKSLLPILNSFVSLSRGLLYLWYRPLHRHGMSVIEKRDKFRYKI